MKKLTRTIKLLSAIAICTLLTSCSEVATGILLGLASAAAGIGTYSAMQPTYYSSTTPQMDWSNTSAYSSSYVGSSSTSSGSSYSSSSGSSSKSSSSRTCGNCNGTGKITKYQPGPPNFGLKESQKQCSECGVWYYPSSGLHSHVKCPTCKGTGRL